MPLPSAVSVAPARERGLKFLLVLKQPASVRRSREGAWIEIETANRIIVRGNRSREGAWIEIQARALVKYGTESLPRGSVD